MQRFVLVALVVVALHFPQSARATVIDFEGLADLEVVTSQFSGLTFTNATVLTEGISLNEFEFPPRSGTNVVFDDFGAMVIDFAPLALEVSGFFTYFFPLTMTAFDGSSTQVDVATSAFTIEGEVSL